jgi:lipopolysaccharide biosynthesis regulator YciM
MHSPHILPSLLLVASLGLPAAAEVYPLILRGKVVTKDGSPLPKQISIQRVCSDDNGSAPGPLVDKKGEYLWRMDVDPMRTRACHLIAVSAGYSSSQVDISALDGSTTTMQTMADITIYSKVADPYAVVNTDNGVPGKSMGSWKAAMKAVDSDHIPDAITNLQKAVQDSPKFALGWHTLGILYQVQGMLNESKEAFKHAVENDPKLLPAYVGLARMSIKTKDWQEALTACDGLAKVDVKKTYPEIYIHQATAHYGMKELDAALASAQESLKMDPQRKRAEYVIGRILEAKGDTAGAREHIEKFLKEDPNAVDVEQIKARLELLGKPEASAIDPALELP